MISYLIKSDEECTYMITTGVLRVKVDEILSLRHRVLRKGLPLETARFDGDDEPDTWHFGVYLTNEEGRPLGETIGCASFELNSLNGEPAWQLRGMATEADYRDHGIGGMILAFAEETLMREGVRLFWCNAREGAIRFYEQHGWSCISEIFEIPTVGPHRKMFLRRWSPM